MAEKVSRSQSKVIYICQQCGKESPKWLGRCPDCQEWNSFQAVTPKPITRDKDLLTELSKTSLELSQVTTKDMPRLATTCNEFNRVLGGGIVPGSLSLLSGDPGIGKSTLLLQISATIASCENRVAYISGEESLYQIRLRADRLGIKGDGLHLICETDLDLILQKMEAISPRLGVIDSIQTVCLEGVTGAPGSITQIRESTLKLMHWAKASGIPLLITGHVTKEGAIAGPKVLEHIVDVVLYMEGENSSTYRILRGVKNRFGSTNEVGIFEMQEKGLFEVQDASRFFLPQCPDNTSGSAIAPVIEGTRPLLVEIQALTTTTNFGLPRRTTNGIDINRLHLIIAVLTKRAGLRLYNQDVTVNVTGGLKINEPAADLATALAIASSFYDQRIHPNLVAIGEVGLTGEIRGVSQLERRVSEASRQGFTRCLIPSVSRNNINTETPIELVSLDSLKAGIKIALQP